MVEPIEIQVGMLSRMGPGNRALHWSADVSARRGTYGGIWPIAKLNTLGGWEKR